MYLVFTTFRRGYVQYVCQEKRDGEQKGPFLHLGEIGPFLTNNASDMRHAAAAVMAYNVLLEEK